jgi:hypothetical protein
MAFSTLSHLAKAGLLSSFLLLAASASGQSVTPPTGALVKRATSTGTDPGRDGSSGGQIKVDASGNMYTTGDFHGSIDLGGITLASPDGYDSYLAKYSPTGTLLWAQHLNGANYETVEPALALDAEGNAYLTGSFFGALSIGGTTLTDPTYNSSGFNLNGYVAKFNSQGVLQWAERLGAAANTAPASGGGHALAVDASGNLLLAAWFSGTVKLGTATLSSATAVSSNGTTYSSQDILLAKLSPEGTVIWARRDGSSQDEDGNTLAVDAAGNVYLGGYFNSSTAFGSLSLQGNADEEDGFLAKYDAAGTPQWATGLPTTVTDLGDDKVTSLTTDPRGNVYLTGNVLDLASPSTGDGYHTFVARYSSQGVNNWSQLSTGSGDSNEGTIVTDAAGNVYLGGAFVGSFTLGSLTLTAPTARAANLFLVSFTPQGGLRWGLKNGNTGEMGAYALTIDNQNQLYVSGTVSGSTTLAGLPVPATGTLYDSYFARLTNVVTGTRAAQSLAALALYPNPAKAAATVALPVQTQAGRVVVRDLAGRLVQQVTFTVGTTQVPLTLTNVAAGLYTVQVVTEAGFSPLARLVVQ